MGGDAFDGASRYMREERANVWNLKDLSHHGNEFIHSAPKPQDLLQLPYPPAVDNSGTFAQDFQKSFFSHPPQFALNETFPQPCPTPATQPSHCVMSGYISTEDHEHAMRQNVKLSQQLKQAREETVQAKREAEQALKAFWKLAEWGYNERRRLLMQLNGEGETYKPHHLGNFLDMNQPDHAETLGMGGAGSELKHLDQQVQERNAGVTYTANGTSPKVEADDGTEEVNSYEPPEADRGSSIFEQVDELIAEEKGRLPFAGF